MERIDQLLFTGSIPKATQHRVMIQNGLDKLHARFQVIKAVNGKPKQGKYAARVGEQYQSSFKRDHPRNEQTSSQVGRTKIANEGEDPYRILDTGQKVYLDELDVLTLLDPPSFLVPMNANTYDQVSFLWKKIDDVPEERRHRLLDLLTPKHISNMWEITGEVFENSNFSQLDTESLLLGLEREYPLKPVKWIGKITDAPWPLEWFSRFKKVFFLGTDGSVYGRVITGGWLLQDITRLMLPLYFEVRDVRKVVATEEPCNIAFEYGEGQIHLCDIPTNFPKPAKHPWPFSDGSFDYIRPVGPGVFVGQWWQEGKDIKQIPEKRANLLLIKDYFSNTFE